MQHTKSPIRCSRSFSKAANVSGFLMNILVRPYCTSSPAVDDDLVSNCTSKAAAVLVSVEAVVALAKEADEPDENSMDKRML